MLSWEELLFSWQETFSRCYMWSQRAPGQMSSRPNQGLTNLEASPNIALDSEHEGPPLRWRSCSTLHCWALAMDRFNTIFKSSYTICLADRWCHPSMTSRPWCFQTLLRTSRIQNGYMSMPFCLQGIMVLIKSTWTCFNSCLDTQDHSALLTVLDQKEVVQFPTEFFLTPCNQLECHFTTWSWRRVPWFCSCRIWTLLDCATEPVWLSSLWKLMTWRPLSSWDATRVKMSSFPGFLWFPQTYPFEFKRLQFLIYINFAMSLNKSQGQSLKVVGLNLQTSCFSHGQL